MKLRFWHAAAISCFCLAGILRAETIAVSDPFADGRRLFEEKKYEEALTKFQKALEYLPHDPTILSWVGAADMQLSRYSEAEQALKEAVERGGTSYKFFELLAASQAHQSKWDAALATVRKYREVGPDDEKKENEEKLRTLEIALHLEKRLECLRREPPDRACADTELDAAWQLKPTDPAQHVSFTQIWMSKGLAEKDPARKAEFYAKAETAARSWVASAAEADRVRARIALGTVLVRQKKFDDAIPVLAEASKVDPSNCAIRLELARAHLGKEDFEQAKAAASGVIDCHADESQGYLLRATAEYGLEDCRSVIKDGAEYVKRSPGKEEPKFVVYCRSVIDSQRAEADRQKQAEDYKKWVRQQLEEGDKAVEESINKKPKHNGKKQDDKDSKPDEKDHRQ